MGAAELIAADEVTGATLRPRADFDSGAGERRLKALFGVATLDSFGALTHAQQVFRITAIPDESPTELARKAVPLVKYLESKLGMKVEFTPVTDYAAAVEFLRTIDPRIKPAATGAAV